MNIQGLHPTITAPIQAEGASGSSSSAGSGSSAASTSDLQSTFLNLLITELQNQDPTSPVDPTQMVSQMVSLNQLDQLISINQTLANMASTSPSNTQTQGPNSPVNKQTAQQQPHSQLSRTSLPTNWVEMQDPVKSTSAPATLGLMNLYGSSGAPTTNSIYNQTGAR